MPKRKPGLAAALAALADSVIRDESERVAALDTVGQGLAGKQAVQVAEAARLAGKHSLHEAEPELVAAFDRYAGPQRENDKGCLVKLAIVKALQQIAAKNSAVFLRAARIVEGAFPGQIDKAAPLRIAAAHALVDIGGPEAIETMLDLLHDDVIDVRATAVHCLVSLAPHSVSLLLRYLTKTEKEATVVEQCFAGLLALDPDAGVNLVAGFLRHGDDGIRTAAAVTLGETRRPEAFEVLLQRWRAAHQRDEKMMLLQAIALIRIEASSSFLLGLIRDADAGAADAIAALSPFRAVDSIREPVQAAAVASGRADLLDLFRRKFRER